ncbi:unnamed protein product [Didymodactylos carnosus]|uniref:B box-type domain-containing protein n=1 Tax=Didymodactylos carnosus TaxID=1234261 RepID=A0A8S2EZW7_9BILA|nr:unnamed protein product [Didymodactylos carnosus]CAF4124349.1 unnamed protein product [Didymodactylos carnosus]
MYMSTSITSYHNGNNIHLVLAGFVMIVVIGKASSVVLQRDFATEDVLMATVSKVQCTKCVKNSAITACEGCSSKLCRRCFNDHRQDLSKELDNVVYEHDMLKEPLETPNENDSHRLLKQIDQWKKDSIDKVNQLADQCRTDVVKLLDKNKAELIDRFRKMTSRVRKGQDDEDYDERDLSKWMAALKELKDELIKPSNFFVEEDKQQPSWIQKIRVCENVPEQAQLKDDGKW